MKDYGLGSINSFLLALLVYMSLVFFVFFKISTKDDVVKYTDLKDSFVDVDLGAFSAKNLTQEKKQEEDALKENEKTGQETTNKEVKTQEVKQEQSDINSLFGNIKDFQEEKSTKVQSSAKSTPDASKPKDVAELFKQLNDNLLPQEQEIGESTNAQMTGVYDEFRGKIRRILEQRWRLYEASGNFKVLIKYYIDSNGKFGYTHVEKSYDENFDAKVLEFLNTLNGKFIAYPPKNQNFQGDMELSDKLK
ncbi:TonB C-terminal domain-containing protein [uncultured Campylobacter sp.]|uniref:TonB C-terminal domain-containing protein n=1 Tax=uncultured Campylobacter sp. TaxID=218934 RepID=UPI002614943E|nr:TonB C-terminal domain-containing protein [uncultured Campylobacter sp.]